MQTQPTERLEGPPSTRSISASVTRVRERNAAGTSFAAEGHRANSHDERRYLSWSPNVGMLTLLVVFQELRWSEAAVRWLSGEGGTLSWRASETCSPRLREIREIDPAEGDGRRSDAIFLDNGRGR